MKFQKAIEDLHANAIKVQLLSEAVGTTLGYLWWAYESPVWIELNVFLWVGLGMFLGWGVGRILSRSYYEQARILMDYD